MALFPVRLDKAVMGIADGWAPMQAMKESVAAHPWRAVMQPSPASITSAEIATMQSTSGEHVVGMTGLGMAGLRSSGPQGCPHWASACRQTRQRSNAGEYDPAPEVTDNYI